MRVLEDALSENLGLAKGSNALQEKVEYGRSKLPFLVEQALFNLVPEDVKAKYLPLHRFAVYARGKKLLLWVRKLCSESTPNGTIYYDTYSPEVTIDGKPRRMAFHRHAIDRVCDRIGPAWQDDYFDLIAVSNFCHFSKFPLVTALDRDSTALAFYNRLNSEDSEGMDKYVDAPLSEQALPDDIVTELLVGYCPVVLHGDFVAAKTLLLPGFRTTPEFTVLRDARKQGQDVSRHFELLDGLTREALLTDDGKRLLRFCHYNGVSLVRQRYKTVIEKQKIEMRNFLRLSKEDG